MSLPWLTMYAVADGRSSVRNATTFQYSFGNLHVAVHHVVVAQHRSGEHADPQAVDARILQDVVLEPEPGLLVHPAVLRRAVGEVEAVVVGERRLRAPDRIFAADEVAAIELVVAVQLVACLVRALDPVVVEPRRPCRA